jgi:hypothetical protein
MRYIVIDLLEFNIEKKGVCRGCALGNNSKVSFLRSESRSKGILDLIHLDVSRIISVASL